MLKKYSIYNWSDRNIWLKPQYKICNGVYKVTWFYLWIGIKREPTTFLEQTQVKGVTIKLDLLLLSEIFTSRVVLEYWIYAIRFYMVIIIVFMLSCIFWYIKRRYCHILQQVFSDDLMLVFFSIIRQSMLYKINTSHQVNKKIHLA